MQSAAEVLGKFYVKWETLPSMAAVHSFRSHGVFLRPKFAQNPRVDSRKAPLLCLCISSSSVSEKSEVFSLTSSSKCDVDYLGESTKGDLNVKREHLEAFG